MRSRKDKIYIAISLIISVIPLILGMYFYNVIPDRVPVHFNFNGVPDSYASKNIGLFLPQFVMILVLVLMIMCLKLDPKSDNHASSMIHVLYLFIPTISLVLSIIIIRYCLGYTVDVGIVIVRVIFVFFLIIGNLLPKVKRNYTLGIKVPWTLDSDYNWNKTHRFAGYLWTVLSLFVIVSTFVSSSFYKYITGLAILIIVFVPMLYSYLIYRKEA